jgi:chemotaxis response regulator CheB
MPREAIARGAVSTVMSLDDLPAALLHAAQALPGDARQRRRGT